MNKLIFCIYLNFFFENKLKVKLPKLLQLPLEASRVVVASLICFRMTRKQAGKLLIIINV